MNWVEYVQVLKQFRARFGRSPPSILTEDGALDHMRSVLAAPSAERRDTIGEPSAHVAGWRRLPTHRI